MTPNSFQANVFVYFNTIQSVLFAAANIGYIEINADIVTKWEKYLVKSFTKFFFRSFSYAILPKS